MPPQGGFCVFSQTNTKRILITPVYTVGSYAKMECMKETLAIIASILALVGNIPYLRDVIRKKIQPHPYTWLVWSLVSLTTFFGGLQKGAGIGALPTGVAELFTIIIFIFSLQYGFKQIRKIDTIFLVCALLGFIPWILTKDPTMSIIIVVTIDMVAFIPTLRKTWHTPRSETPVLYSMNVLRHILTLFSLGGYNIATMLHSIVMIILNSSMTTIILGRRRKQR